MRGCFSLKYGKIVDMEEEKRIDNIEDEKLEQLDKEDTIKETESVDIFQWANLTDGIKNDLDVEFFLFNKSFIPFTTRFAGELNVQF